MIAKHAAFPWVAPFVLFLVLLGLQSYNPLPPRLEQPVRVAALTAALWFWSRHVIDLRVRRWLATMAVGAGVFLLWIAPDVLIPGYRQHWLFQNPITGIAQSSVSEEARRDWVVLLFRSLRAILVVPVVEELFWRGFLMRWLIREDFEQVPLGTYAPRAFWISAVLFAAEHGPYWDVGLLAGLAYNWWIVRTRSLGDCILAHAVTNAALCAWVVVLGKWEYWM